jgi:hypothetical protein
MLDQVEELLRAGIWLGPAVLGSLCYGVLTDATWSRSAEDFAGAVMLGTAAIVLTIAGMRFNHDKHAALAPAIFAAMFFVSWSMR